MLLALNKAVRRVFAWPLLLIGITFNRAGAGFIIAAAWTLDHDIEEMLEDARR